MYSRSLVLQECVYEAMNNPPFSLGGNGDRRQCCGRRRGNIYMTKSIIYRGGGGVPICLSMFSRAGGMVDLLHTPFGLVGWSSELWEIFCVWVPLFLFFFSFFMYFYWLCKRRKDI